MNWLANSLIFLLLATANLFAANKITAISQTPNSISIEFSNNISPGDIKNGSVVVGGVYKRYFDIRAVLTAKIQPSKNLPFDEIRVAQFSPDTVRIVFAGSKETILQTSFSERKILIKWELKTSAPPKDATLKIIEASSALKAQTQEPMPELQTAKETPKSKLIVLDPGHGGKDPGAVGQNGIKEKDITLAVAKYAEDALRRKGYTVLLTRSDDVFVELKDRTGFANSKNADIFISIHVNAVDPKRTNVKTHQGLETYFLSPARSERAKRVSELENGEDMEEMDALSKGAFLNFLNREKIVASNKLAIDAQKAALSNLRVKYPHAVDGGVREAPFWVLVGAQMPAVLIEVGYISHPQERTNLCDPYYQAILGKAVADGIEVYFANQ